MKSDSFIYLHWNVFFLMDSVQILSCIKGSFGTRTHTHALTNTHTHRRKMLLGGASCYEGQQWARNRQQVEGCGCSWCGGVSRQLRHLLLIWMRLVLTFKPTFLFFLFTSFPVSSLLYLFSLFCNLSSTTVGTLPSYTLNVPAGEHRIHPPVVFCSKR